MKVQLPWYGKAAGRSQQTIYQSYWGRIYTRAMPFSFHYPDTTKQQVCQSIFFDIQRVWIPIYQQLTLTIAPMQKKDKNPFNMLSKSIYRILNPYGKWHTQRIPKDFGLDKLNRVRPVLGELKLTVDTPTISLTFDNNRPWIGVDMVPKNLCFLLFNITRQSMLFEMIVFEAGAQVVEFQNVNEWKADDEIAVYASISGDFWLGNFNLFDNEMLK